MDGWMGGCRQLESKMETDMERLFDKAVEDRNVKLILNEMRRDRCQSAEVQKCGCDALFRTVQHNAAAAREAASLGVFQDVASAINAFSGGQRTSVLGNSDSQPAESYARRAILHFGMCYPELNPQHCGFSISRAALEQGAFDSLKKVMDGHPEGSAPNESALLALGLLSTRLLFELQQQKHKGKAFAKILIVPERGF
ncbi:hypothetical protein AK812_SmicGene22284 [Symbiodinium microadriaticum]|uniref:Uncharacterized protein n=1 Tax=Symbiodinium microadriaticum TaxID=2951 RepID=A0A1Q9DK77_SYMMI|nr:hypothetical protein AK812_SmicGene22284 [Symbiodinium microadriaticum]